MTAEILSTVQLNRATLARQLLLERAPLSAAAVIEHLVGMQAQWPSAPYVGIWTRTTDFERSALERELASGNVVKTTAMRQTLHLVTRRDYGVLRAAFSEANWVHNTPSARTVAASLRELARSGQVTRKDVLAHLEREHGLSGRDAVVAWRGGRIVAHLVPHHETAFYASRPEVRYVAIDEPELHDPVAARAEIVRRYLAAFGPASRADIARWSMLSITRELAPAIERLGPLRRFRDEHGRQLIDVPDAPLPDADTPVPVRFLPKWDNVLLGYADRTRILPTAYRERVIRQNGDVKQTFLVNGFVAGIWTATKGRVTLEPFEPLPKHVERELKEEAARLELFLAN